MNEPLYLCMPIGDFYGYAVCGKHLLHEFLKFHDVKCPKYEYNVINDEQTKEWIKRYEVDAPESVDAPALHVANPDMTPIVKTRGEPNAVYLFHEYPFNDEQKENLRKHYDILIAGSKWLENRLRYDGFENVVTIPQGVDRDVFNPNHKDVFKGQFIVFSGGKYEHRKGQDLVMTVMSEFERRHDDVALMCAWGNPWDYKEPEDYERLAQDHGVKRVMALPFLTHKNMSEMMNTTQIGLFPNRIEGGTNLVLMEYLSCGIPVIATDMTGHGDVLDDTYSFRLHGDDDKVIRQSLEHLEYAYSRRELMHHMGREASIAMDDFTWGRTAGEFEKVLWSKKLVTA